MVGTLPCLILIPGLFFIPESPRWLVSLWSNLLCCSWLDVCYVYWNNIYYFKLNPGKNGNDGWVWSFFASSSWFWYWYFSWSKRNQGNSLLSSINANLDFSCRQKQSFVCHQYAIFSGKELNNFVSIHIISQKLFLCTCILQRSVASTSRRTAIRFSDLKQRRYWFPLMVILPLNLALFIIFSSNYWSDFI